MKEERMVRYFTLQHSLFDIRHSIAFSGRRQKGRVEFIDLLADLEPTRKHEKAPLSQWVAPATYAPVATLWFLGGQALAGKLPVAPGPATRRPAPRLTPRASSRPLLGRLPLLYSPRSRSSRFDHFAPQPPGKGEVGGCRRWPSAS